MINHLVNQGTFWDNGHGWDREAAEQFAKLEWAPSGMVTKEGIKKPCDKDFYPKRE